MALVINAVCEEPGCPRMEIFYPEPDKLADETTADLLSLLADAGWKWGVVEIDPKDGEQQIQLWCPDHK